MYKNFNPLKMQNFYLRVHLNFNKNLLLIHVLKTKMIWKVDHVTFFRTIEV